MGGVGRRGRGWWGNGLGESRAGAAAWIERIRGTRWRCVLKI